MKKALLQIVPFLLLTCACKHEVESTRDLYAIDSLLAAQVKGLADTKASLKKIASVDTTTDTTLYTPSDSLAWAKELEVFQQLDAINKPVSQPLYIIDNDLYDPGSNLTVKAFTDTTGLPVQSLRIYYDGSLKNPRKIEAIYNEKNAFYESSRLLTLQFQQINNRTTLTSYAIEGGQKMILSDSVVFAIRGKIQVQ